MKKISVITAISLLSFLGAPQIAQANEAIRANATEAEALWQEIVEQDSSNAVAYYNLGIALGNQGKWDEAIAAYRHAIQKDPALTVAYINLGKALSMTEQLQAATRAYQTALRLDPQQSLVRERLQELSQARGGNVAVQLAQ